MFYSKTTNGFYDETIHGSRQIEIVLESDPETGNVIVSEMQPNPDCLIPLDAVEITKERHVALLDAQSQGKIIQSDEDGKPVAVDAPVPTEEQVVKVYMDEVQRYMDKTAQEYGYDDLKSAVTYADEPIVEKYQKEGQGFREWRSLNWIYCEQVFSDVKAGLRTAPTYEELIAELPELIIPV